MSTDVRLFISATFDTVAVEWLRRDHAHNTRSSELRL